MNISAAFLDGLYASSKAIIVALVLTAVAFLIGGLIVVLISSNGAGETALIIGGVALVAAVVGGLIVGPINGSRGLNKMSRNMKAYEQQLAK